MRRIAAAFVLVSTLTGCAGVWWTPLASHTIAVGPDQSRDVVWLENAQGVVVRCTESPQGPVCTPVVAR